MKDLAGYFENPFADERIALDRKKNFGDDSIERITVQNTNGKLDDLLTATKAVQDALFGGITNLATDRSQRQARTKTTDGIIAAFKARNSKLNAYFISTGVKDQDVYTEFFPQGIQAYTAGVKKENAEQLMQSLVTAITNNTAVAGGPAVLAEYTAFQTDYAKARSAQLNKNSEISSGMESLDEAEAAWDDQMFGNLLFFAAANRNQPDNIKLYMDQTLLEHDAHHNTTLTGKIKGTVTDNNGHPVKNVVVHILNGKTDNSHSDANGFYLTHQLPVGTWQIDYSKGDKKVSRSVDIKESEVLELNVVLDDGKSS